MHHGGHNIFKDISFIYLLMQGNIITSSDKVIQFQECKGVNTLLCFSEICPHMILIVFMAWLFLFPVLKSSKFQSAVYAVILLSFHLYTFYANIPIIKGENRQMKLNTCNISYNKYQHVAL